MSRSARCVTRRMGENVTASAPFSLAERVKQGDTLPVYIQHNPNFKLPENPDTPIIMIGPGTGVAPFRAFLGEREETGAEGKTWLFYGDQHFSTDFLYQIEWQRWLKEGVLTRMDVAFSRDTDQKVYVQHRMLEKSRELYQWLQEGACVYVCGDEKKMAHDVHAALANDYRTRGRLESRGSRGIFDPRCNSRNVISGMFIKTESQQDRERRKPACQKIIYYRRIVRRTAK